MGKKVKEFEREISRFLSVKHSIAINNGTSALDIILFALKLKRDEVIVPV